MMLSSVPINDAFGRYELVMLLARGGMAEVYLARMNGAGGFAKQLVIKRMLSHLANDPEFVEMFLNEGRIAARLLHPNVCQVYEIGAVGGAMFMAMEYLDGLSWGQLIPLVPRNGSFELRCAAGVIDQICEGLRYAHELNDVDGNPTPVVHRDVSPHNMMITTSGACKLLDFGVSKVLTEASWTQTGILKGKLSYMAPEQLEGKTVDLRADVFSMGVVLWESLTGQRLFWRGNDYLTYRAIVEGDLPPVRSIQPSLPAEIDGVIGRALDRDANRRYPTIRAFASELRDAAALVGGPLDHRALAGAMHSMGAALLAERAAFVSRALGGAAAKPPPARKVVPPPPPAARVVHPSDAYTVHVVYESAETARDTQRSPWWIALGALGALGLIVVAVVARLATTEPARPAAGGGLLTGGRPASVERSDRATAATGVRPRASTRAQDITGGSASGSLGSNAGPDARRPGHQAGDAVNASPAPAPTPRAIAGDVRAAASVTPAPAAAGSAAGARDSAERRGEAAAPAARAVDATGGNPRRKLRDPRQPPASNTVAVEPGMYSVDSKPYAAIFIDDQPYGDTPLYEVALLPGTHQVRALCIDGKAQTYAIEIAPGKLTSSGTLAW